MSDIPAVLQESIGKIETVEDIITVAQTEAMMVTLGRESGPPKIGDKLPETWHGIFCTAKLSPSRLNEDGLASDQTLLPSLDEYPRRMFGGARFRFEQPIRIGDSIRKESKIARADLKDGKSGKFIVAVIEHSIIGPNGVTTVEENDILYRLPAEADPAPPPKPAGDKPKGPPPPPGNAVWKRSITPDPVMMFRHSALTFNGHRIHYDRDYAVKVEKYPGLLVMGTLIARELLELLWNNMPGAELATYGFRSGRPLFDTAPFTVEGEPSEDGKSVKLWALDDKGLPAMMADATLK